MADYNKELPKIACNTLSSGLTKCPGTKFTLFVDRGIVIAGCTLCGARTILDGGKVCKV